MHPLNIGQQQLPESIISDQALGDIFYCHRSKLDQDQLRLGESGKFEFRHVHLHEGPSVFSFLKNNSPWLKNCGLRVHISIKGMDQKWENCGKLATYLPAIFEESGSSRKFLDPFPTLTHQQTVRLKHKRIFQKMGHIFGRFFL